MKKNILLLGLMPLFVLAEPSSEIPEKREFTLNEKINPCENFHQYVCSNVEAGFKLRDDRSYHDFAFNDSSERILELKKSFMSNLLNEKKLSSRAQQFKNFYASCMDVKSRSEEEKKEVKKLLNELAGIKNIKSFVKYLNMQSFKGKNNLIGIGNDANVENPHKLDLYIGSSLMQLPDHSYYENAELMKEYKNLIVLLFKTVDTKMTDEVASKKADAQIELQKEFIKVYPVTSVRRQRRSEKRMILQKEALQKYPNLQLEAFTTKAPETTLVKIPVPESLQFLNDMMIEKNLELLKEVYLLDTVPGFMDEAYPEYYNAAFEFEKKYFGGPLKRPELQERCTRATSNYFSLEVDQVLMERKFPNFNEDKVNEIATKIRASIINGLEKNQWLTVESKAEAINKVTKARLQLVKPHTDKEWDFLKIQKYSPKDYLDNKTVYHRAVLQKTIAELRAPTNQEAWGMSPLVVNAYYSPDINKFVMPIGILQYPFYDQSGALIDNLGAVGAVMGHELGHGIDDQGSKFDSDGKLRQWMSMQDMAEFSKRGQKLIEQFNKIGHNGTLTQGENIGDLVGLTFAYQAAFPNNQGHIEDKKKFFISYARVWCSVVRPELKEKILKTDPHSLGSARINEQVKHQPGFQEAFQCKANDKMVLPDADRVKIW